LVRLFIGDISVTWIVIKLFIHGSQTDVWCGALDLLEARTCGDIANGKPDGGKSLLALMQVGSMKAQPEQPISTLFHFFLP
jgi:hypothetical protein